MYDPINSNIRFWMHAMDVCVCMNQIVCEALGCDFGMGNAALHDIVNTDFHIFPRA